MHNLAPSELAQLCVDLINTDTYYTGFVRAFLSDVYYTGCRPHEPIQINRWSLAPGDPTTFVLQPLKGNAPRFILRLAMSDQFNFAFNNNIRPYGQLTLRQIEYQVKLINPVGKMYVGNRECVSYIYRYSKVNQLLSEGYSWPEIQSYFGWFNPDMPFSYASRIVSVTNWPY